MTTSIFNRNPNRWLLLILLLMSALGILRIAAEPLWWNHEEDYYTNLRFLVQNGRLPTTSDVPAGVDPNTRQVTQPPLYFLAAAPVTALFDPPTDPVLPPPSPSTLCIGDGGVNTPIFYTPTTDYQFPPSGVPLTVYALRVFNLLLGLAAAVFTYTAARTLFPQQPGLALAGAALFAFEPTTVSAIIHATNDAPLYTLAAANLFCAARLITSSPIRWRYAALMFLCAALAILTRLPGWALLIVDSLVLLTLVARLVIHAVRGRESRRQLRTALLVLLALVVGVGGLALFNLAQSGSVFGRYSFLDARILEALRRFDLSSAVLIGQADATRLSFLEIFNQLQPRVAFQTLYVAVVVIALLATAGMLMWALLRRRGQTVAALGLLVLMVFVGSGLVYFRTTLDVAGYGGATLYNTAAIFTPLRYYAPAIPALALLIAVGLWGIGTAVGSLLARFNSRFAQWLPPLVPIGLALVWALVLLLASTSSLVNRPRADVLTPAQFEALVGVTRVDAGDGLPRTLGYQAQPQAEAGSISLTVYAQADMPTEESAVAVFTMRDADGTVINTCEIIPANGWFPTTLWQPNRVVGFQVSVPNCAGDGAAGSTLQVDWRLGEQVSPDVPLLTVPQLANSAACPGLIGVFTGENEARYRVTAFTSPETVLRGERYIPSVNWIVEMPTVLTSRVFTFTHENGTAYTCNATDAPLPAAQRGEFIYFDRCPFTFPNDAPTGTYSVSVSLNGGGGTPLLTTAGDTTLRVGEVAVR